MGGGQVGWRDEDVDVGHGAGAGVGPDAEGGQHDPLDRGRRHTGLGQGSQHLGGERQVAVVPGPHRRPLLVEVGALRCAGGDVETLDRLADEHGEAGVQQCGAEPIVGEIGWGNPPPGREVQRPTEHGSLVVTHRLTVPAGRTRP